MLARGDGQDCPSSTEPAHLPAGCPICAVVAEDGVRASGFSRDRKQKLRPQAGPAVVAEDGVRASGFSPGQKTEAPAPSWPRGRRRGRGQSFWLLLGQKTEALTPGG